MINFLIDFDDELQSAGSITIQLLIDGNKINGMSHEIMVKKPPPPDIKYSEKEVNKIIGVHHSFNDIALLRRELISKRLLERKNDGSIYWKTN